MKNKIIENRRNRIDLLSPAEATIYQAQVEVEKLPADERLTNAGSLLSDARSWVADFIENIPIKDHYPRNIASLSTDESKGPISELAMYPKSEQKVNNEALLNEFVAWFNRNSNAHIKDTRVTEFLTEPKTK